MKKIKKLHVGCGTTRTPGWYRLDANEQVNPDLVCDASKALPIPDGTVSFIFNEHFIEHLQREEAANFIKESYRILERGGVHRIATICVEHIVKKYLNDWDNQEWLYKFGYIKTVNNRCKMINAIFHMWGHQYIFDEADLTMLMNDVGFSVTRHAFQDSPHEELENMEWRKDSTLILEGIK